MVFARRGEAPGGRAGGGAVRWRSGWGGGGVFWSLVMFGGVICARGFVGFRFSHDGVGPGGSGEVGGFFSLRALAKGLWGGGFS